VVKGGSYLSPFEYIYKNINNWYIPYSETLINPLTRDKLPPDSKLPDVGFRVLMEINE
jgi:hypothetical protein